MSPSPKVSIIIPCFNLGLYLEEAVDSVFAQTEQDFEILIVDDGSDDAKTQRLLADFDRPKTRVWRTENQGLARARNFLIEKSGGHYLCALDADDRLHPEFFKKALQRFEDDPGLSFVSSWLEAFGDEQWLWRQDRCDLPALLAEDTVMTAALVRRDAVVEIGCYAEDMPHPGDEDWDLWLRLVVAGHRGTIIPEVLFFYRRRQGQMSRDCVEGETHLDLVSYLHTKHAGSYDEHLREVLLVKEREISALLKTNHSIEMFLGQNLEPNVERRRVEIDGLERRLQALRARAGISDLQTECERARREVDDLRNSLSWRLTAPLRALFDLVRGRRA